MTNTVLLPRELPLIDEYGTAYLPVLELPLLKELIQKNQPKLMVKNDHNKQIILLIKQYFFKNRNLGFPVLEKEVDTDFFTILRGVKKMMRRRVSKEAFEEVQDQLSFSKRKAILSMQEYLAE